MRRSCRAARGRSATSCVRERLSSPAGGGTPEYQAGLPRCGYAQASAVRADPVLAAPDAWHIRIPASRSRGLAHLGAGTGRPSGRSVGTCGMGGTGGMAGIGATAFGGVGAASSSSSRRPRPTAASRCKSDVRRFSGCSSGSLAAPGANLVLRRHRQFVDSRHAHAARRHPFRLRRNKVFRLRRLRRGGLHRRIDEQRGLRPERPDGHLRTELCGRMAAAIAALADSIDSLRPAGCCCGRQGGCGSGRRASGGSCPFQHAGHAVRCQRAAAARPRRSAPRPRRDRRPLRQRVIDAGRDHRHADDAFQAFVEGGADDDVGVLVDLLADAGGRFVDLVERQIAAAA